jgi:NagD protein
METVRAKKGFICDMDGVLYRGREIIPGAKEFLDWLIKEDKKFLFLTNASTRTPAMIRQKLARMGLDVDECHLYTASLATAKFLSRQHPGCSAYVIGKAGLTEALEEAGITLTETNPDYVVVGETDQYNYSHIVKAMQFVLNGAKLIGTNSDLTGPTAAGLAPACRALVIPIEATTGRKAYFVGKPNPLMMRTGLKILGVHSGDSVMIGDRMDTDIIAAIESGLDSVLVLSGVTTRATMETYPYRPRIVVENVGEIAPNA